jgi:hypothetical protein
MAEQRWALVDAENKVRNIIVWDDETAPDWQPPEGFSVRLDDGTPIEFSDAPAPSTTADDRLTAAQGVLAGLETLGSTPSINDVVAILSELKQALEQ